MIGFDFMIAIYTYISFQTIFIYKLFLLKVLAYPCIVSRVVRDCDDPFSGSRRRFDDNGQRRSEG